MGCTAFSGFPYGIPVLYGFMEALCLVGGNEKATSLLWKLDFYVWKYQRSVVI